MSKIRYLMLLLVFVIGSFIPIQTTVKAEEYFSLDSGLSVNGRTLLPMRSLFESLGATVEWNQQTKTVTAKKAKQTIVLTIGNKQAKVNGKTITIDVPALIIEGSTYVPVRFVTESLGAKVDWDSKLRRATVHYENSRIEVYVSPAINVSGVEKRFRPNPSYIYEYIPYEGLDVRKFVGMKGSSYVWTSQYFYGDTHPPETMTYSENQYGLYVMATNSYFGTTTTRLIKYPIYVGQTWDNYAYGEYTTSTIVKVGSTVKTPVKTFHNVIEIIDQDGMISYYAEGFGFVQADYGNSGNDFGVGLVNLKKR